MKKLLLALLLICSTTTAMALNGPLDKPNKSKEAKTQVIEIIGVINGRSIVPLISDLYKMINTTTQDIHIVLNSPGGGIYVGLQFINAIEAAKSKGVKVKCYVSGIAASMAFQILTHCNERYALRYSLLLWHPPRVAGFITLTTLIAPQSMRGINLLRNRMIL